MGWIPATDGYEVTLVGSRVAARRGGTRLSSVPKALKEHDSVLGLRQLADWLSRHDAQCRQTVQDWMVRSLPIPAAALVSVWPDESWRSALAGLVVVPVVDSCWDGGQAGFLRQVDTGGRLGVVDLAGESRWWTPDRVVLPHPVLLDELAELREFAVELGIKQGVLQLFRETWSAPADRQAAVDQYSGGRFEQLRHLTGRAVSLGYPVRGGYASLRLWQDGQPLDARIWLGEGDPSEEAETGSVEFVGRDGTALPLAGVGPVAWSEGLRMAAGLYAGRVVPGATA